MSIFNKAVFGLVSLLCLESCTSHYASNADKLYLQSRNGVDLVVPSPMTTSNLGFFYKLPPQNQNARVSIKPTAI